jgi:putative ABC transport system permease protein
MTNLYGEYYRFPFLNYHVSSEVFLTGAALSIASSSLGAIGGVRAAVQLSPAVAMSPPPPPVYRVGMIERLGAKAGFTAVGHMIARHIARWPGRSSITVVGVGLSLGLLFSTLQFVDSAENMLDDFFFRSQKQDLTVTFIEPRNEDILYELSSIEGVIAVEATRATPVRLSFGPRNERTAIESARSDARLFARVDAGGGEVALPPAGLMLSRQLAEKLGVSVGQSVQVELLAGRRITREMAVSATIDELVGTLAYADEAVLDSLVRDGAPVGSALLRIDPVYRDHIISQLGERPVVLGVTERAAAMRLFEQVVQENILTMVGFYIVFAGAIAVGVVYNSARILFSERAHELATLRVLGYHRSEVGTVLLGEIALLVAMALPVGLLLGHGMGQLMAAMFSSDLFRLPFAPSRATYGFSVLVILFAALFTAFLVARRVNRLDMVRVLKARE